jgi:glucosamine kinase
MPTLIADSGATKTDWLYLDGTETTQIKTQGLHPSNIQQMSDAIDIENQVGSLKPGSIHFFGAGCGNPVSDEIVRRFLQPIFPDSEITIRSDLEGSGKAFFGYGDGVIAVLGTGSVSAIIKNGTVLKKSAALGFAIGDEGSAADLGRRLLRTYFRKTTDAQTIRFIGEKLEFVDYATMMNRIYRAGKPNRELASIAGEVLINPLPPQLIILIREAFADFISQQLSTLDLTGNEEIVCTGKVAHIHRQILTPLLKQHGFKNVAVYYPVISAWRERLKAGDWNFE